MSRGQPGPGARQYTVSFAFVGYTAAEARHRRGPDIQWQEIDGDGFDAVYENFYESQVVMVGINYDF